MLVDGLLLTSVGAGSWEVPVSSSSRLSVVFAESLPFVDD